MLQDAFSYLTYFYFRTNHALKEKKKRNKNGNICSNAGSFTTKLQLLVKIDFSYDDSLWFERGWVTGMHFIWSPQLENSKN